MSDRAVAGFAATIAAGGEQTKLIKWHDNVPGLTSDLPSPGRMVQLQGMLSNVANGPTMLLVQLFADDGNNPAGPGMPLTDVVGLPLYPKDSDPTKAGALASVELYYQGPVWARVALDQPAATADVDFCAWAQAW